MLEILAAEWQFYLSGVWTTIWLVTLSLVIGLIIALPCGIARTSDKAWLNKPVWLYTYFFRGTPLLIQLFLIYYGAAQWDALRESWLWPWLSQAWFCALLAFSLNTAAYTAEIIRGGILSVDKGEIEAAKAFGMTAWQRYRRIILPSAFRRVLPAYGNEVIFMLHGSAMAGVITIVDITGAADIVYSRYYAPFEAFIIAAACYLVLTFALVWLFRCWEKRWLSYLKRGA